MNKRSLVGFRPPSDVEQALTQAEAATGASATDLMIRCIRNALPRVVSEVMNERQKALVEFQSTMVLADSHPDYKTRKRSK